MFNSTLLTIIDSTDLRNAVQERQIEIAELYNDLLDDCGDVLFDGLFRAFFPPGFIDRDIERAKSVLRGILNITRSPIIRRDVDAIYCYVMYQMIDCWFDGMSFHQADLLPDGVKDLLSKIEKSGELVSNEEQYDDNYENSVTDIIRSWFIDKESCLNDLRDSYDSDYMDETFAETVAEMYLNEDENLDSLGVDLKEILDLLPDDYYDRVGRKLKIEEERQEQLAQTDAFAEKIWPLIENSFRVAPSVGKEIVTSFEGAIIILDIIKHWVENNGGWRVLQNNGAPLKEIYIQKLILLGANTYIASQNLDITCEGNNGVGQEDIKISRGNDKTIIELKLSSNSRCLHGYEKQLPRYGESEHTKNMIFCLIDLGNEKLIDRIKEVVVSDVRLYIIDAKPQRSASVAELG